ncbi:MAG: hypothetical protein AAGI66_08620 [Cyanobacteria bacterium P01_H01_bin.74]
MQKKRQRRHKATHPPHQPRQALTCFSDFSDHCKSIPHKGHAALPPVEEPEPNYLSSENVDTAPFSQCLPGAIHRKDADLKPKVPAEMGTLWWCITEKTQLKNRINAALATVLAQYPRHYKLTPV